MGSAPLWLLIVMLAVVVACVVLAVVFSRRDSREAARQRAETPSADDEHWRANGVYYNRDNPAVFVPRRGGFGWTINFGRPSGVILMAAFVAFVLFAVVFAALQH